MQAAIGRGREFRCILLGPSSLCSYLHVAARGQQELPPEESLTLNSGPKKKGQLRPAAPLPINSPQATDWLLRSVIMWKGKAFSQWPLVGWGLRLDSLDKVWHSLAVRANKYIGVWYYVLQLSCETFSVLEDSFVPGTDFFLGLFK